MPPKKQVGKQTKVLTPSKLPSSSKQTTTKKPSTVVSIIKVRSSVKQGAVSRIKRVWLLLFASLIVRMGCVP